MVVFASSLVETDRLLPPLGESCVSVEAFDRLRSRSFEDGVAFAPEDRRRSSDDSVSVAPAIKAVDRLRPPLGEADGCALIRGTTFTFDRFRPRSAGDGPSTPDDEPDGRLGPAAAGGVGSCGDPGASTVEAETVGASGSCCVSLIGGNAPVP